MRIDKIDSKFVFEVGQFQTQFNQCLRWGWSSNQSLRYLNEMFLGVLRERKISFFEDIPDRFFEIKTANLPSGGYLLYFICFKCKKRVRRLYSVNQTLGCRFCQHLTYLKDDRWSIEHKRLLLDPEMRHTYVSSGSFPKLRRALIAECAINEIKDAGKKIGKNLVEILQQHPEFL